MDTVKRSLKYLKRKIKIEACSFRAELAMLAWCPYSFNATWAVFCLSNVCQCRFCIDFGSIWECKWTEALVLTCTYCELCSQLWGYMHITFCLTLVFCLSFAALLQAVIAGDLLKVSTEHWVSPFSQLFAGLIYCKFYHTSAQNINRLL